jgi:uncharacterized protein (DUF1330 family)
MTAYAVAHLHDVSPHEDVLRYLERIQPTLDAFGGRFLAHGPQVAVKEGSWPGTIVLLEFPDRESAEGWYTSPAYQEILPLRTDNVVGDVIIFDGVRPDHDPARLAAAMRAHRDA